ncbi:MAG: ATP-binding cassette domain-containing protein, partial [Thermoflexus sp.]
VAKARRAPRPPGGVVLRVQDLRVPGVQGRPAVDGVSFEVRSGEIFAIAGVLGNVQSELVEALVGLRPWTGEVELLGQSLRRKSPAQIAALGLAHIPEDRLRFGMALNFDVAENSILSRQWEPAFLRGWGRLDWAQILTFAKRLLQQFQVIAPGPRAAARSLSGGNQQKLVVGRELTKEPRLILAVHPTRGLDVASTAYIRELLVQMRDAGKAVLLISADLDEVLELSDRVAVMYEGKFLGMGPVEAFTRETIGMMMGGIVPQGRVG